MATADETAPPLEGPAPAHSRAALMVLGIAGGLCLTLLALAHSPRFEAGMRAIRWEEADRSKNIFLPVGLITEDNDRVLNEEIPSTDHRRGGVYILGTSNAQWAFRTWALPESSRPWIHNVALAGTGHIGQGLLLRYLVEREGLLAAGPDKALVVFCTGYQNVGFMEDDGSVMTTQLAARGFYERGPGRSIVRSGLNRWARAFSIERSRVYGLAGNLKQLAQNLIRDRIGMSRRRVLDPAGYNQGRINLMGPDWRAKVDAELAGLAGSIDYLNARKVPVVVILMPQGSWEDNVPFDRAYDERLLALCRTRQARVLDLRELLVDDEFADSNHLTPAGVLKFEAAVLPTFLGHLRSAGLLTSDDPSTPR